MGPLRPRSQRVVLAFECAAVVAAALLALEGCRRERERVGTTTTTAAEPLVTLSLAADRILAARCTHDQLCLELGYPEVEHARGCDGAGADIVAPMRERCADGIAQEALEGCVAAVRGASCSGPEDDLDALPPCRATVLCGKLVEPRTGS